MFEPRTLLTTTLAALALAACGGSGSTAELHLMDAPPDGVTSVRIFVASMQVHLAGLDDDKNGDPNDTSVDDDDRWESLTVGRSIDLVAHQGEAAAEVLGQLDLPEGKITQIRLVVDTSEQNVATKNGADCALGMEKVAKKGIKINHPFKAFESKEHKKYTVVVDFDLEESMKPEGGCYRLEPKLKLHKVKLDNADVQIQ